MLIVSAGMPRSASTWLFNVLRLIFEDRGMGFESGWFYNFREIDLSKNLLIKIHDYNEFLAKRASFIFYSYRDVRDAILSSKRKFNTDLNLQEVERLINEDKKWRKVSPHLVRYEDVISNPVEEITKIVAKLGMDCDPDKIRCLIQGIHPSAEKPGTYNQTTLYHFHHITKGGKGHWKEELDSTLQREITNCFGDWLVENNYEIE